MVWVPHGLAKQDSRKGALAQAEAHIPSATLAGFARLRLCLTRCLALSRSGDDFTPTRRAAGFYPTAYDGNDVNGTHRAPTACIAIRIYLCRLLPRNQRFC